MNLNVTFFVFVLDSNTQFNHEDILPQYLEELINAGLKYQSLNTRTNKDINSERSVIIGLRLLSMPAFGDLIPLFGNPNVVHSKFKYYVKPKRTTDVTSKLSAEPVNSETYFENAFQYATAHQSFHLTHWTHKIKNACIGDTQMLKENIISKQPGGPILIGCDLFGQCGLNSLIPISDHFEEGVHSTKNGLIASRNEDHRESQKGKLLSYDFLLGLEVDGTIEKHGTRILENPLMYSRVNSTIKGGGLYQRYMLAADRAIRVADTQCVAIDSVFFSSFLVTAGSLFSRTDDSRIPFLKILIEKNKFEKTIALDSKPLRDDISENILEMNVIMESTSDVTFDTIEHKFVNLIRKYGALYSKKVCVKLNY